MKKNINKQIGLMIFILQIYFVEASENPSLDKFFVFIICSYNNEQWYQKNLDSVFEQTYPHFHVIYIDDASTDNTAACVEKYIQNHQVDKRITLIKNKKNEGSLSNHYKAIHECRSDQIIIDLDGDDWLSHKNVLSNLNRIYSQEDIWLTHGQLLRYPYDQACHAQAIPQQVIAENSYRTYTGAITHLKTYYAGLFKKILKEDLLYEEKFIASANDLAFMLPMVEMAGQHVKFIPSFDYVYNDANPLNDHKIRPNLQLEMEHYIRAKTPYQPISNCDQEFNFY